MVRFFALAFGVLIVLSPAFRADAQVGGPDSRILLTWRPQVYAPPDFTGRLLPTARSRITASVAVIENGRPQSLAGQSIYWYMNDQFIESGRNKETVSFLAPDRVNTSLDLMVRLPDYKGGTLKTITIPVVPPHAVIDAPFPRGVFASYAFTVRALPYFFNAPSLFSLNFDWRVADQKVVDAENPNILNVAYQGALAPGARSDITLLITGQPRVDGLPPDAGSDRLSLIHNAL
jgi:hypothetical protein